MTCKVRKSFHYRSIFSKFAPDLQTGLWLMCNNMVQSLIVNSNYVT